MKVYVALNSVPDYSARAPSFKSVHKTFEGAAKSLFPNREDYQKSFRQSSTNPDSWYGPDGFGTIKLVEVQL